MNKELKNEIAFLFSNKINNPDYLFQGYCFVGADYIFGSKGAEKYLEAKGVKIKGGEDGCYVSAERVGNKFYFNADFSGNKKIFYYYSSEIWVVSNSILLIVEFLKSKKIPISINYTQLFAIGIERGAFFNQLYTENTFVNGIKILPTSKSLCICDDGYSIKENYSKSLIEDYADGLHDFMETWISRINCLYKNGIEIQSDLTGGADSRTVFTLMNKASEILGKDANSYFFRSGSTPGNDIDLRIATEICSTYGFEINKKPTSIINKLSGEDSYGNWKTLCLGVYHPVYFPNSIAQPNILGFGGAGAENHRIFYKEKDFQELKANNSKKISPNWLSYNFNAEVEAELQRLNGVKSNINPLILHYREYRNRMHGGRTPQYTTFFNPLGSRKLSDVSEVAGVERIKNGQINYDLMHALLPSVLDIPFDNESKDFNKTRRNALTHIEKEINIQFGEFYGGNRVESLIRKSTKSAMQFLNEDFHIAKEKPFVKNFFGPDFISLASKAMADACANNKFPHAIYAQGVVAIIAGGVFD